MSVAVLAGRDFRLLWIGGTVSQLGSWLLVVAVPYQVFRLTGSATATGVALALESLPALLVGPWAGVLVDRWDRVRTMLAADLVAAASVPLMLVADRPGRLWLVYGALVVENLAAVFFRPASRAAVPELVGVGRELAAANSLGALSGGAARLVGPALGALLLSTGGIVTVVLVDAASYLLSAAATARVAARRRSPADRAHLPAAAHPGSIPAKDGPGRIRRPDGRKLGGRDRRHGPDGDGEPAGSRGEPGWRPARLLAGDLADGLRYAVGDRTLRGLLVAGTLFLVANAALTALLVPFTVGRLGVAGSDVGYVIAGLGVGYVLGAGVYQRLPARLGPRALICAAQAGTGIGFLVLFTATSLPVAVLGAAVTGVPGVVLLTAVQTEIQRGTPDRLRGRVGAAQQAGDAAAAVLGALLGPAVVAVCGLATGLVLISAAALVAAAISAAVLAPGTREPGHRPVPR